MGSFDFFASCPRGLEEALAAELSELGHQVTLSVGKQVPGGVHFSGRWAAGMATNFHSHIANRVFLRIVVQSYQNEQDIYDLAATQPWEEWFSYEQALRIDVTGIKTSIHSLEFVTLRIKDAICDRFRERTGRRPNIDRFKPDVRVFVFLTATDTTIYIDTSGEALFKRGWRLNKGTAPLRENLAAGILRLAGWRADSAESMVLYDPMCGSGTFLVEAAQILLSVPPGANRRFGFEKLKHWDISAWKELKAAAMDAESDARARRLPGNIFGSDISGDMLIKARANFERAGVSDMIGLKQIDARDIKPPVDGFGILVTNPPYGKRIEVRGRRSSREMNDGGARFARAHIDFLDADFYRTFGDTLKHHFSGWSAFFLTSDMNLPGQLRLRESRRAPLFNGALECRLFRFDMVTGRLQKKKDVLGNSAGYASEDFAL
ncbi:THUMP domain-containing class I SAM-dependent RNA methyltransferase [Candidatus Pandoraea novymonadis]|uniref:Ribosomal RNA large subunit methyltransferase L n=1 Tax=Candidatus Pandoraea novymonadis TaxID=1808959 RepID=A0ABX5FG67_9BURK|nr:class I SAM-dependent RNA methyltransferase [Candidatus Pandoraea novymonadis]PSB92311.1 Ribosomal RNA large subunit methyltransferase L [Candidatus Pandoraea novymonadis]